MGSEPPPLNINETVQARAEHNDQSTTSIVDTIRALRSLLLSPEIPQAPFLSHGAWTELWPLASENLDNSRIHDLLTNQVYCGGLPIASRNAGAGTFDLVIYLRVTASELDNVEDSFRQQ